MFNMTHPELRTFLNIPDTCLLRRNANGDTEINKGPHLCFVADGGHPTPPHDCIMQYNPHNYTWHILVPVRHFLPDWLGYQPHSSDLYL